MATTNKIKESLKSFISIHGEEDIDEIFLNYASNLIESGCGFEDFYELFTAYFPQLLLGEEQLRGWVEGVVIETEEKTEKKIEDFSEKLNRVLEIKEEEEKRGVVVQGEEEGGVVQESEPLAPEQLREMFPSHSNMELLGAFQFSSNDLESAVALLLNEDNCELIKSFGCGGGRRNKGGGGEEEEEEEELGVWKERLMKRYGYVDMGTDKKEFRPLLPKEEPKKLLRYREGQVVSTKGERYTEVKVNKDGTESAIKTYISKTAKTLQQKYP